MSTSLLLRRTTQAFSQSSPAWKLNISHTKLSLYLQCYQHHVLCQVLPKVRPLRTLKTNLLQALENTRFSTELKTCVQDGVVVGQGRGQATWDKVRPLFKRHMSWVQDSKQPKKMNWLLRKSKFLVNITPKRFMPWALATVSGSVWYWYSGQKFKVPLSHRTAVHVMTDAEALENSWNTVEKILTSKTSIDTHMDAVGNPIDPLTLRVERVMARLRSANPEYDTHLMTGSKYRPLVVSRNRDIYHRGLLAFVCGVILIAREVLNTMDDDELGFLLAHEMSHIIMQHEVEWEGSNIFVYHFFNKFLIPVKEKLVDFDMGSVIATFREKFSFHDPTVAEREADKYGHMFACKACYDYRKFATALQKMDELNNYGEGFSIFTSGRGEPGAGDMWGRKSWRQRWEKSLLDELDKQGLWLSNQHPPLDVRVEALRSQEYTQKAERYRQEANCPPLQ